MALDDIGSLHSLLILCASSSEEAKLLSRFFDSVNGAHMCSQSLDATYALSAVKILESEEPGGLWTQ